MNQTPTRNLTKNQWGINQISSQNQSNIDQKSTKNRPKIDQNSIKIEKCRALRLGSRLGAVLDASWRRLGRLLGAKIPPSWPPKSKENRLKIHAKIDQKFDAFQVPVLIQFWSIFGGKMEACWHQNRIKNRCQLRKADFAKSIEKQMNFHWFLWFWGSKLASKIDQKSIKNWSPRWMASWHRFLVDFGGFWEPSWEGKSSQERSKID